DDYTGVDDNDDGIGDSPYIINLDPLIQDNFPMYNMDGILSVKIIFPSQNEVFAYESPEFLISGNKINSTWYSLDYGAINFSFTGLSGKINQIMEL
ncbi:MAG: hypothetical protein ACTSQU_17575, partial [Promethearchaeota archaeon]